MNAKSSIGALKKIVTLFGTSGQVGHGSERRHRRGPRVPRRPVDDVVVDRRQGGGMSTESNLSGVVDSLTQRHPLLDRSKIEGLVAEVYDSYRFAPVQAYVPLLIHREIDAYLRDLERGGSASTRLTAAAEKVPRFRGGGETEPGYTDPIRVNCWV
jgi:hypothetical protein